MTLYPEIHHRSSVCMKPIDYSSKDAYFVTICTFNREFYFKNFSYLKEIVLSLRLAIPGRVPNVKRDEFIVMPNHISGIIFIAGAGLSPA